jgi:YkoY family integral membrane protein
MWDFDLSLAALVMMAVLWLVFLEGLLSADNALVLAMMVRPLPRDQQKRALRYGMVGAFTFRVIAVALAKYLLRFWFLEVAGGLYLVYLAAAHFLARSSQDEADAQVRRFGSGFWGTVVSVELADIAFSIDSILAAVAMANGLPSQVGENGKFAIVVTGGILGIITMRFVAGYFIILLERFRGLEAGAYGLVLWIGLKLISGGLHRADYLTAEMNPWVFWIGMLAIAVMGLLYQPRTPPPPEDTVELVHRMTGLSDRDDDHEIGNGPGPDGEGAAVAGEHDAVGG